MLPFKFTEQKDQQYYHNLKVFIMGTDVTPWLTSDVNCSYAINGGINVLSFSLSNQRDAFVLTNENLIDNKFRNLDPYSPTGMYSELAKYQIWSLKNAKDNGVDRNLKHEVKTYGPILGSGSQVGGVLSEKKDDSQASYTVTHRYPFSPRSLVFHKFDHIRVFAKNPLSISNDEWYCIFTGFLDQKPYTEDLVSGMSTIKISAQDVRYAMSRMRTQNNPAASIGNGNAAQFSGGAPVKDSPAAGYFNDLISQSFNVNHVLGGLTFKESINFLILGQSKGSRGGQVAFGDTLSTGRKTSLNAVGEFTLGLEIKYDPVEEKRKEMLEKWNNLVLFGDYSLAPSFLTYAQMLKMGQETHEWGSKSVWKGKVHYLYPSDGSPVSNLVETSYSEGRVEDKVQWSTRLELLLDICDNIDYVMYASPLGDIIFEFPMWDFSPADYGPYEDLYRFKHHVIDRTINDEGGEAVSALVVTSDRLLKEVRNPAESGEASPPGVAADIQLVRTIYSNTLASRIGVQVKTIYKPGVTNPNALSRLGMIEFAKATADYNKYSFKAQYRPFLCINRPIYDVDAYRIGHANNVSYTWRLRDTVDVEIDMNYVRKGELNSKGEITFRFITGGEANPVSYNKIFTDTSIMNGNGVGSAAKVK